MVHKLRLGTPKRAHLGFPRGSKQSYMIKILAYLAIFWGSGSKGNEVLLNLDLFKRLSCHQFVCPIAPPSIGPLRAKIRSHSPQTGLSGFKSCLSGIKPGPSGLKLAFLGLSGLLGLNSALSSLKSAHSVLKSGLKSALSGLE